MDLVNLPRLLELPRDAPFPPVIDSQRYLSTIRLYQPYEHRHCVVVKNLPELGFGYDPAVRLAFQFEQVKNLLKYVCSDATVVDTFRMGTFNPHKMRPLKVVFTTSHAVKNFVSAAKNAFFDWYLGDLYRHVYVRPSFEDPTERKKYEASHRPLRLPPPPKNPRRFPPAQKKSAPRRSPQPNAGNPNPPHTHHTQPTPAPPLPAVRPESADVPSVHGEAESMHVDTNDVESTDLHLVTAPACSPSMDVDKASLKRRFDSLLHSYNSHSLSLPRSSFSTGTSPCFTATPLSSRCTAAKRQNFAQGVLSPSVISSFTQSSAFSSQVSDSSFQ